MKRASVSPRTGRMAGVALAMALGVAGTLVASPAQAYVRYESKSGNPYSWREGCIWMLIFPKGMTDMKPEEVYAAEHAAQAAWSQGTQSCTYMQIIDTDVPAEVTPPAPAYDLTNTTVFHNDRWCRTGAATNGSDCYPSDALAITSVWTTSDGHIYDADIEVNAVNFRWADLVGKPPMGAGGYQDLQNTLTHETGHLLGLDHTCYRPDGSSPRGKDDEKNPVPDCDTLDPNDPIRMTTMFPSADLGDVAKRSLAEDDIRALCDIYPVAQSAAHACVLPETAMGPKANSGGCALAPRGDETASWLSASLGLGLLAFLRRRRRG